MRARLVHGLDRGQKLVGTSKKKDAPEPQKGDGDQLAELLNKKTLTRDEAQRIKRAMSGGAVGAPRKLVGLPGGDGAEAPEPGDDLERASGGSEIAWATVDPPASGSPDRPAPPSAAP